MGRTLFTRLLITYMAIIVIVVLFLTLVVSFHTRKFVFETKQKQLITAGNKVTYLAEDFLKGSITVEELRRNLNDISAITQAKIYILRAPQLHDLNIESLEKSELSDFADLLPDLQAILAGQTVVRQKYYAAPLGTNVVFVGMPVYKADKPDGVVLLFAPLAGIYKTLSDSYMIIASTAFLSLVMAVVLIFMVSRRISRPLEIMSKNAIRVGHGDAVEDMVISGEDEIAHLAESFNNMKNEINKTEMLRRDLIANVSHELRTPLTSLRGFIQGILDGVVEEKDMRSYLELAFNETGRLNGLINDLLQLARLQAGSVKVNKVPVDLYVLVEQAVLSQKILASSKGQNIQIADSIKGITVNADADHLYQILLNLLENAVKYSDKPGMIVIDACVKEDLAEISVSDEGCGMPVDETGNIFDKFYRVEQSRSQDIPGTGLGLSIVRELVTLNCGIIYAESELGKGTRVVFTLPII